LNGWRRLLIVVAGAWALIVFGSMGWNIRQTKARAETISSRAESRSAYRHRRLPHRIGIAPV